MKEPDLKMTMGKQIGNLFSELMRRSRLKSIIYFTEKSSTSYSRKKTKHEKLIGFLSWITFSIDVCWTLDLWMSTKYTKRPFHRSTIPYLSWMWCKSLAQELREKIKPEFSSIKGSKDEEWWKDLSPDCSRHQFCFNWNPLRHFLLQIRKYPNFFSWWELF